MEVSLYLHMSTVRTFGGTYIDLALIQSYSICTVHVHPTSQCTRTWVYREASTVRTPLEPHLAVLFRRV